MASATASNMIEGQSLKSHFMPIWELAQLIQSFDIFSKVFYSSQQYLGLNEISWMALLNSFFFKFCKFFEEIEANTQIGTKCDFRDGPWITLEAVADAMPERIYNPIMAMGFSAMFTFQLNNSKR